MRIGYSGQVRPEFRAADSRLSTSPIFRGANWRGGRLSYCEWGGVPAGDHASIETVWNKVEFRKPAVDDAAMSGC
jgi:hypothetical protein